MKARPNKGDARWSRTRQRLLDGGRVAFAATGVESTTVLEIVRAAGVSQPSFYNHFDSKDELAREIAAEYFRADREAKLAVFAQLDDPAEAIAINVGQTLAIATEDPVVAWVLVKSGLLRELIVSSDKDPLVEMISAGVQQGRFVVADAQTTAFVIRSAALGLVQGILNGQASAAATRCFQELVMRMLGLDAAESSRVVQHAQAHTAKKLNRVA